MTDTNTQLTTQQVADKVKEWNNNNNNELKRSDNEINNLIETYCKEDDWYTPSRLTAIYNGLTSKYDNLVNEAIDTNAIVAQVQSQISTPDLSNYATNSALATLQNKVNQLETDVDNLEGHSHSSGGSSSGSSSSGDSTSSSASSLSQLTNSKMKVSGNNIVVENDLVVKGDLDLKGSVNVTETSMKTINVGEQYLKVGTRDNFGQNNSVTADNKPFAETVKVGLQVLMLV